MENINFENITLQELSSRWAEISNDYKEKYGRFVIARQAFMRDCDSRDRKVENRKSELQAENQALTDKAAALGEAYTGAMLDGKDNEAAAIKRQIDELAARRFTNQALIDSMQKPAYSKELLSAADGAFDVAGSASSELDNKRGVFLEALEQLRRALNALYDDIRLSGNNYLMGEYQLRMHRRFNHQPEE